MNVCGKLFLPIYPDGDRRQPADDRFPLREFCVPGTDPERVPVRRTDMRTRTGIPNQIANGSSGFVFVRPVIHLRDAFLDFGQQFHRELLDLFDVIVTGPTYLNPRFFRSLLIFSDRPLLTEISPSSCR